MTSLQIHGRTRFMTDDGQEVEPWEGTKQRQLVELLALHHPHPVSKSALAEALYDGRPPQSATRTLESHVCVVRRGLVRGGLPRELIVTGTDSYRLATDLVVDADVVGRLVRAVLAGDGSPGDLRRALRISEDPLLSSSPYAPWATEAARVTEELLAEACLVAAEDALGRGAARAAIPFATRALATQPLSERACRAAMRAHAGDGDRCRALLVFADFRERVRDELGVEPADTTRGVYLEVLDDDGGDERSSSQAELFLLGRLLAQVDPRGRGTAASAPHLLRPAAAVP